MSNINIKCTRNQLTQIVTILPPNDTLARRRDGNKLMIYVRETEKIDRISTSRFVGNEKDHDKEIEWEETNSLESSHVAICFLPA